ncbi:ATP-binding protein [Campylobacter sp. RM16188]|uniref:ATP-binding protein n=1 Tax=Campylobacter sp. RM16188 TaxID=1705725 RepID=UPI001556BAAC|nr:ATP-binding protein [Campylobacter sp. RM16188]
MIDWSLSHAAVFRRRIGALRAVHEIDFVELDNLVGMERQKEQLIANTQNFIDGKEANNAILWGARGCGKSSLVKAVFTKFHNEGLRLIELRSDELEFIVDIIDEVRRSNYKFIIYCDDLSFEAGDTNYKFLKPILEGSIEKAPKNVLIYATSNRRHLISELKSDNEGTSVTSDEIHYAESVDEKISLSDRFGLWISFYQGSFAEYLKIVDFYFKDYTGDRQMLHELAKNYSALRASRSGRTAKQFYLSYKEKLL